MRRRPERYSGAALLLRTIRIDVLQCPCGTRRRVLSLVCDPAQIQRVLEHMGLSADPPERAAQGGARGDGVCVERGLGPGSDRAAYPERGIRRYGDRGSTQGTGVGQP